MTTRRLFGRAFTGGSIQDDVLVTIRDGVIAAVEQTAKAPDGARRTDGVIAPGFVDVHVHGGNGADFMDAEEKGNSRILEFHARNGTTALAATTLSASAQDLRRAVAAIARSSTERGAEIVAVHLEGPYISPKRSGAQDRASIRPPAIHEINGLLPIAPDLSWLMTIAPEIAGAQELIEYFRGRITFSIGHTAADYAQAVAALEWGASHFTHLFNAMTPLDHRQPGVVGAALESVDATAELIADGIHVHPVVLRIAALAKPHRIALVTDAMRACGMPEGGYKLYGYDVTVAGGAARIARRNACRKCPDHGRGGEEHDRAGGAADRSRPADGHRGAGADRRRGHAQRARRKGIRRRPRAPREQARNRRGDRERSGAGVIANCGLRIADWPSEAGAAR